MPEKTNTKEDRLKNLQGFWQVALNSYNPWSTIAKEDLDFYFGGEKQWASADLQLLKQQKRPVLTFNHLLSLVNLVSGYQRQNRQDIKVYNRKGGSKNVADILTEIIKHIHDNCYGDWETSMAFVMGLIAHKGFIGINIDYDDDVVNGDIVLQNLSPFNVLPDPSFERYDMSDAQFIFQHSWLPKSRIAMAYPEKEKELEGLSSVKEIDKQLIPYTEGDTYHDAEGDAVTQVEKYRYRVKQCWWKKFETQKFLVGTGTGMVKRVDFPEAKIKKLKEMYPSLGYIKRVIPVLNATTFVGDTELDHLEDPFNGVKRYPIIPFFCYWIENKHFGLLTQLKDPQREINKRVSQALHHLNQSANSGWIADNDALVDWTVLEDFGSKPGIVIKKKKGSFLQRTEPARLSEGHITLAQIGKETIKAVSGVNPALAGETGPRQESGYLMELRRSQGLINLESIFDNFRLTKQILGTTLIEMIQKTDAYSRQEMLTLVLDGETKEINLRQQIAEKGIDQIKNDLTIGKYKCVVSASPHSATERLKNFYMLVEAVKAGLPIPPEVILEASDLPMKEEIKEALQRQQAQGPQARPG